MEGGGYVIQISENINGEMSLLQVLRQGDGEAGSGVEHSGPSLSPSTYQLRAFEMILNVSEPLLLEKYCFLQPS